MNAEVRVGSYSEDGRRFGVYAELTIEPAQAVGRGYTVDHSPIEAGALDVAIMGSVWYLTAAGDRDRRYSEGIAYGQVQDYLSKCGQETARRIFELWQRWHLNGMRANCAHMPDQKYTPGLACPEGGRNIPPPDGVSRIVPVYTSGSAWLFEPVPDAILAELRRLFGKPDGWALPANRHQKGAA